MLIKFDAKSVQCLATAEKSSLAFPFLGLILLVLISPYSSDTMGSSSWLMQLKPNLYQNQIRDMNLFHLKLWTHEVCHSREDRVSCPMEHELWAHLALLA